MLLLVCYYNNNAKECNIKTWKNKKETLWEGKRMLSTSGWNYIEKVHSLRIKKGEKRETLNNLLKSFVS